MTVITELDKLIQLLEAEIPANPESKKNQSHAERLEREMAKYFRSLEQAFPYAEVELIYNRYIKPD